MSESKDDRQFDASEQKLRKAREEGDIPRSTEVSSALVYAGMFAAIMLLGVPLSIHWLAGAVSISTDYVDIRLAEATSLRAALNFSAYSGLLMLAALAIPGALVMVGLIVQQGLVFSPKKVAPDFKRINPIKNAGQKFGKSGLVTFAMSVGRVTLVGLGGWLLFANLVDLLSSSLFMGEMQWVSGMSLMIRQALLLALSIAATFAVLDFMWKRHEFLTRNKMTRKEVEDEFKESEGDPHLKAARRQKAVEIAMSSMLKDVEGADVVMVNPTHYAVALKWERGSGKAPVCVAKGTDEIAAKIRERAAEHKVPIYSDPPATRALHATVEIGDEIQQDHFAAVAAAIRFAQKMREKARQGW